MAFRKTTARRSPASRYTKRPFTRLANAVSRKAPRRFNWVPALDQGCGWVELPPHACSQDGENQTIDNDTGLPTGPAAPVRFGLRDPGSSVDPSNEHDDETIVRVHGYIFVHAFFRPWRETIEDPDPFLDCNLARLMQQFSGLFLRTGLSKDQFIWDAANEEYDAPTRDPLETEEWSDGRFLRTFTKEDSVSAYMSGMQYCVNDVVGVCSDVAGSGGGGGASAATNGASWGVTEGAIDTEIDEVTIDTQCVMIQAPGPFFGPAQQVLTHFRPFKIPLSSRRRIRLRESEGLSLWMNYNNIGSALTTQSSAVLSPAVGFLVRPHVKLLIET